MLRRDVYLVTHRDVTGYTSRCQMGKLVRLAGICLDT
jgi:hypothetical protein